MRESTESTNSDHFCESKPNVFGKNEFVSKILLDVDKQGVFDYEGTDSKN